MKKHFTWVTVVALIVIVVSGIFFGIQEKPQVSKALEEKTEKKATAVKKSDKAIKTSDKKVTAQQDKVSTDSSTTELSATEDTAKEQTSTPASTKSKTIETVVPSNVDVDSINDYNSANAEWDGNNIVVQVVATGDVKALANFAKPYADLIKEMNNGVSDVIVHIYSSNDALSKGQMFAEYKNGALTQM